MSKAFAMAGARVGYLAASPAVVDALRLVRLPYHLSALTQAAARTALAHADELLGTVEQVKAQRDRMVATITSYGLQVVPTESNFLLFGPFDRPADVWQALLDRGVLVRDLSGGPGLAGWLRVNAGTEAETTLFLDALKEITA
jgi:histidinol-phosphate aminotransferase